MESRRRRVGARSERWGMWPAVTRELTRRVRAGQCSGSPGPITRPSLGLRSQRQDHRLLSRDRRTVANPSVGAAADAEEGRFTDERTRRTSRSARAAVDGSRDAQTPPRRASGGARRCASTAVDHAACAWANCSRADFSSGHGRVGT
jgi:hypothetical protein